LNRSFANESVSDSYSAGGTDNDGNNSVGSLGSMGSTGSLSSKLILKFTYYFIYLLLKFIIIIIIGTGVHGGSRHRRRPHKSAENTIPTLSVMLHGSPTTFKKAPTQTLAGVFKKC
jgi:hypothetical protein